MAILVGTAGAPCHEDRARGARDTIAKYKDMEIVATEYDMDSADLAYDLTLKILTDCPDLDGIICCNMSNPVGAAKAIMETASSAVIVGMDHDQEALRYLDEGVIYCLGVQDCYSIGFDTVTLFVVICINLYKSPLRLGQLLQQESSVSVYVVLPHKWIQQAIRL